jgi:hypothetical protein
MMRLNVPAPAGRMLCADTARAFSIAALATTTVSTGGIRVAVTNP